MIGIGRRVYFHSMQSISYRQNKEAGEMSRTEDDMVTWLLGITVQVRGNSGNSSSASSATYKVLLCKGKGKGKGRGRGKGI